MKNLLIIISLVLTSTCALAAEDGTGQGKSSNQTKYAACNYLLDAEDGTGQDDAEDGTGQNDAEDGTGQGSLMAEDGTGQDNLLYFKCISQNK